MSDKPMTALERQAYLEWLAQYAAVGVIKVRYIEIDEGTI